MKAARRRLERFQAEGKVRHRADTTCATGFDFLIKNASSASADCASSSFFNSKIHTW